MKSVFITSRAGTHPMHKAFAQGIEAEFQFVDHHLPWHGVPAPKWKRYLSWLICPFLFPKRRQYDLFINSGPQFPQVFMKKLGLLSSGQQIAVLLDNESLFFLKSKKHSKLTHTSTLWALKQYDIYLCVSQYQRELLEKLLDTSEKKVITLFNGVSKARTTQLTQDQPNLDRNTITCIANVYSGWRRDYKGFDLLIESYLLASKTIDDLQLNIIGEIEPDIRSSINYPGITLVGKVEDLGPYLMNTSLYIQPSVGESWGIAALEAMMAGVPTLVTSEIGVKEVVKQIDPKLIVKPTVNSLSQGIIDYFQLSSEQRVDISMSTRKISSVYTEENAVHHFKTEMKNLFE